MVADKRTTNDPHIIVTPMFGGTDRSKAVTHIAQGIDVESLYDDDAATSEMSAKAVADLQKELGSLTGWKIEEFQPFFVDGAPPTFKNSEKPAREQAPKS